MFSFEDRKLILELWHQNKSVTRVINKFKRLRGVKSIARTSVSRLVKKFEATGSLQNRKKVRRPSKRTPQNIQRIKNKNAKDKGKWRKT